MNSFGISDKSYSYLMKTISQFSAVDKALIFGSRAKGNYRNGSDIDVALKGNELDYKTVLQISTLLNEELPIPYHIDVLNYSTIKNENLKNHVDRVGKIFYEK